MKSIEITTLKTDGSKEAKTLSYKYPNELLEALQSEVGGFIEVVNTQPSLGLYILLANEEGRINDLPNNPHYPGLVGNLVLMKSKDLP